MQNLFQKDTMYLVKTPAILKKISPKLIWDIPSDNKEIYLTFDDGPVPEVTTWVLDELKKFDAKASFFCIGKNIEENPLVFKRILTEGHSVGNHTYRHLNGWKTKNEKYFDDVEKCSSIIKYFIDIGSKKNSVINHKKIFRPPYGQITPSQYSKLYNEYSIVMWDVLSGDFDKTKSGTQCLKYVVKNGKKGSIIVFHDSVKAFPRLKIALPGVLKYFSKEKFIFKGL